MSGTVLNTDDTRVLKIKSLIKEFTSEEGKFKITSCKIFEGEWHEREQIVDKGRVTSLCHFNRNFRGLSHL